MGSAILKSLQKQRQEFSKITILKPSAPSGDLREFYDGYVTDFKDLKEKPDIILLAVKSQMAMEVCANLSNLISENTLIISTLAGISTDILNSYLDGENHKIIRAMPNTAITTGKGVTTLFSNSCVNEKEKAFVDKLFANGGATLWVNGNAKIDASTCVSGSGPAYFFMTVESLSAAGQAIGLTEEESVQLARQTLVGAAALAERQENKTPLELRNEVTSPGGTTEAALDVLLGRLPQIYNEAVKSAYKRAQELAN